MKPLELSNLLSYLHSVGMSAQELSRLHHFSKKGRNVSYRASIAYFQKYDSMHARNLLFASRCKFIAEQHQSQNAPFSMLVSAALMRHPDPL